MKKNNDRLIAPDVLKKMLEQNKSRYLFRKKFMETKDPQVVVEYLKKFYFALKERWVVDEVMKWRYLGRFDLLKKAFLPGPGNRETHFKILFDEWTLFERVNEAVKAGEKKMAVFAEIGGGEKKIDSVRAKFNRAKRREKEYFLEDFPDAMEFSVFPAKVEFDDDHGKKHKMYGCWSYKVKK